MKNLTLLLCFFSINLFGQNYNTMLSDSSTWNFMESSSSGALVDYFFFETYQTKGDTIVDGINYTKIGNWWNYLYGGFREDTLGRVYYRSFEGSCLDTLGEFLAYDYSLEVGDTMTLKSFYTYFNCDSIVDYHVVVNQTDSIEIENGEFRKEISIESDDPFYDYYTNTIIEGVGSVIDLLYFLNAANYDGWHGGTFLICHHIGQTENFINPYRPSWTQCYLDPTTPIEKIEIQKLNIFPNPVSDILFLDNKNEFENDYEIEIINLDGYSVFQSNVFQSEINVSQFSNGLYFIFIKNEKEIWANRFVKQ